MAHWDQLGGLRSKKKVHVNRTSGIKDRETDDKAEWDGSHKEESCYFGRFLLRGATQSGLSHRITLDHAGNWLLDMNVSSFRQEKMAACACGTQCLWTKHRGMWSGVKLLLITWINGCLFLWPKDSQSFPRTETVHSHFCQCIFLPYPYRPYWWTSR